MKEAFFLPLGLGGGGSPFLLLFFFNTYQVLLAEVFSLQEQWKVNCETALTVSRFQDARLGLILYRIFRPSTESPPVLEEAKSKQTRFEPGWLTRQPPPVPTNLDSVILWWWQQIHSTHLGQQPKRHWETDNTKGKCSHCPAFFPSLFKCLFKRPI